MTTSDGTKISITRKGNRQVEYNNKTGVTVYLKVKWVNVCSYQLIQDIKGQRSNGKELILTVNIIEVKENYAMLEVSSNLFNMKIQDRIFRDGKN